MEPPLVVRIGINLGPVRLVKDINGQPNIVGDGINVAQRVMGFADPGQILRRAPITTQFRAWSQEYAGMFHYAGVRVPISTCANTKVYAIGYPGDFTSTQRSLSKLARQDAATGMAAVTIALQSHWDTVITNAVRWERRGLEFYRNAMSSATCGNNGRRGFLRSYRSRRFFVAVASRPTVPAPAALTGSG